MPTPSRVVAAGRVDPTLAFGRYSMVATFSPGEGAVEVAISQSLPVYKPGQLYLWVCKVTAPGSSATTAQLLINGVLAAEATIPAGAEYGPITPIVDGQSIVPFVDGLQSTITEAGTDASGFVGVAVFI